MSRFPSSCLLWIVVAGTLTLACGGTSDGAEDGDGSAGTAGAQSSGGGSAVGGGGAGGQGPRGGTGSGGAAAGGSGGSANGGSPNGGTGMAGSGGASAGPLDCDHRKIMCRRAEPECPVMQVPRVEGTCYGECVPIAECGCTAAEECPHAESYTCLRTAMRCGPYLR